MVLPDIKTMIPEFTGKIESLIREGATVIGNPPERSPSLSGFLASDERVRKLVSEVWGNEKTPIGIISRRCFQGKIITGEQLYIHNTNGMVQRDTFFFFSTLIMTSQQIFLRKQVSGPILKRQEK